MGVKINNTGLVSVIMPVFNGQNTIVNSINSILEQEYKKIELIIIDDCSSDDTLSLVSKIDDPRITVIKNENNLGVAETRNKGIKISQGQYIAFLDSDDIWHKDKLSLQISAMKKYKVYCSHGSYGLMSSSGDDMNQVIQAKLIVNSKDMMKYNHIGNLTGIYDQNKLGKFYQKPVGHEDYYMWNEVISKTDSVGVLKPIALYRLVKGSVSSNKIKCFKWHYSALKDSHKLPFILRVYYMFHYCKNGILKLRTTN
ncbi:glycosyltransferase family 2 protein [Vibrio sp. 299]|uniref:glycosyltransferase family 2 protein n=1 Tax=Vibrio TaxID=662 RepID=UPI0029654475|nr:glycosyltransferase family 2 protein [Vibrio sp. 299]MDW1996609.1 glycosyltransferase family 2 protein [Vibrio sp. 299]